MNILRWRRKSKKKIKLKTILLFAFSLIMTTFAWFAYSKVLEADLDLHILSWDMEYQIAGQPWNEADGIGISTLHPAMDEKVVKIDILNNGETIVGIEYFVQSVSILGETYTLIQEGQTKPAGKYLELTDSYLETNPTTGEQLYRGAITNDITKIPFTIEIEHSAKINPKTTTSRIDEDTGEVIEETSGGVGYLSVKVNWVGDNHELDTDWGYDVGEYLAVAGADASVISIGLLIDSYQLEPEVDPITGEIIAEVTQTVEMPSTTETAPYLPTGFTRVAGTTLENGLVIKDALGNEYVWVEVPKTTTVYGTAGLNVTGFSGSDYTAIENDLKAYSAKYRTREDVYTSNRAIGIADEGEYTALKQKMLKSIYQNGGFYIGRYETGIANSYRIRYVTSTNEVPVIKADAYPYNFVSCSQAQALASNMSSGDHTSSLMFGLQWDLTLKYLEVKAAATENDLKTDSTLIGNYYNHTYYALRKKGKYSLDDPASWLETPYEKFEKAPISLTTGANSLFSKQNIYDLAGNMSEWTLNIILDGTTPIGGNGGDYSETSNNVATNRADYSAISGFKQVGFRVTIF